MEYADIIMAISAFIAMIGVCVMAWESKLQVDIAQTAFEDNINEQYREIARGIPVESLLGGRADSQHWLEARELIYNYIDQCNQKVLLYRTGRVRTDTWKRWSLDIWQHMQNPDFIQVWEEIKAANVLTFKHFKMLEDNHYYWTVRKI